MRRSVPAVLMLAVAAAVAGCGGGHTFTPGQSEATAACRGNGSTAALAATKAAAVNPSFATLAADENALAASDATQTADVSDGTNDSGTSALVSGLDLASPARQKVLADCVALGLPVTPAH